MRASRGITLLELTIAMAIASVLAAGLAVIAAGTIAATESGDRLIESVQTARHLADRIDRLLATADPAAVKDTIAQVEPKNADVWRSAWQEIEAGG